ncbi:unnamed protein product [Adineta steineri]|uniref:Uncharacterized protein n=1 Tax=Adineta steineri TaxID=433720 RepID=A0A814P2Y7_9BILA|nr:unnamed protein product [Adineta steineri]
MQSNFSIPPPPISVDSIVIKDSSSDKPTTALLHSSNIKAQHQHHLYNYWTLNDRLRSRNEKLAKKQQTSCRLAFYSLWLFFIAGVMIIIVYRFTDECPLSTIDQQLFILKCFRHILLLAAICITFIGCCGIIFGACRYFRSQPKPLLNSNEHKLHLTQDYDVLPIINTPHKCCYQTSSVNGISRLSSPPISNHNDEHSSNNTATSSVHNISPQRKIPPFTYEELPSTQSFSPPPLSSLPILSNIPTNSKCPDSNHPKSVFLTSSTSASSSLQSNHSTKIITNNLNIRTSYNNNNNNERNSSLAFEDAGASTPTSYTTCACGVDVWERQ